MKIFLTLVVVCLLSSCATRQDGLIGNGVFNNARKTSAVALADADRVDAVQRLYNDGLYDRARQEVDRLLADGIRHPQVFMLKAQLMRQADDLDGAIPWCSKAVEASPLWVEPRVLAAQIHLTRERYAAAASMFALQSGVPVPRKVIHDRLHPGDRAELSPEGVIRHAEQHRLVACGKHLVRAQRIVRRAWALWLFPGFPEALQYVGQKRH